MTRYEDTAGAAGALGNTEIGAAPWVVFSGTWTKSGGKFAVPAAAPATEFFAIDTGKSDVDITATVADSCEGIYFRIQNATNFLRVFSYGTTHSSWINGATVYTKRVSLHLEQVVAGVGTIVWSNSFYYRWERDENVWGPQDQHLPEVLNLRVVARKNKIKIYNGEELLGDVTLAQFQTETRHGLGRVQMRALRDTSETGVAYTTSRLDNFGLTTLEPPVPTVNSPSDFGNVTSSTPTLIGSVNATYGYTQRIEYQLATNSGFTVNLRTVTEPTSALRLSGSGSIQVPSGSALTQTTWYLRARTLNEFGDASAWTSTRQFAVQHPPSAVNLSPTGGQGLLSGIAQRFSWVFSDTSSTDTQTAYQLIIERNDNGTLVLDTGKVSTASQFTDRTISAAYDNIMLRWKIRLWDAEDVAGVYTTYQLFKPTDASVAAITSPANASTVITSSPLIDWIFTASGGRTQATYRVVIFNTTTGLTVLDTGVIVSADTQYQVATSLLRNANNYTITVTTVDSVGIADSDTVSVSVSYTAPDAPGFTVYSAEYESAGYVRLSWVASVTDPNFVAWRIYRRIVGDPSWTMIDELTVGAARQYYDYLAPSQTQVEYSVGLVVLSFGEQVESQNSQPVTVSLGVGGYWLIDKVTPSNSVHLSNVNDDSYQHNRERSELVVIGRGRHVDLGQNAGVTGSLGAKLRDNASGTARAKKLAIEALYERGEAVYLRNPFGDVRLVSLGDPQIGRIAGVGPSEFVDVTISYSEVF